MFKCASCIVEKDRSLCKIEVSYTIMTGSTFCLSVCVCLSVCLFVKKAYSAHQRVGVILCV
jgi:hypothetical protein